MKNADFDTLCREIDRRLTDASPLLLAIDGRCGSGKTTLALHLRERYGEKTSLYRMDDFFLPFELRWMLKEPHARGFRLMQLRALGQNLR